jgi:hypothetical protein
MSTMTAEAPTENSVQPKGDAVPDASVLEDKTPMWFRTTGASVIFTVVIGFVFIVFANMRLWHTDLWDHVNYGSVIQESRAIPVTEPLLPLAEGVSMTNLAWLSQLGLAWLADSAGLPALQFCYGILIAACLALVAWRTVQNSASILAGLLAVGFLVGVNLPQFLVIRPQLIGTLFFCIVLVWSLGRQKTDLRVWIMFPLMFAVWANCHGSFTLGLTLLGLAAIGRFADVLTRGRSIRAALCDASLHRTILLIQLSAVAVLLNPYGLMAYTETFRVAANPNIDSMFEWDALTLRTAQGQRVAAGALLLFMTLKMTPRRIRSFEFLVLALFGILALWSQRMITWWAPAAAIITSVHAAAWVRSSHGLRRRLGPRRATGLWSVVNLGLCWILFSLTNFGIQTVKGRTPEPATMVSAQTPVTAVAWLNSVESLPRGIAFVPAEWAGYVMHEGPSALQPMVNLHVHVIPQEVWNDYLRLRSGPGDAASLLERYGINLVMVDANRQPGLMKRLQKSEDWSMQFSDQQGAVFFRLDRI